MTKLQSRAPALLLMLLAGCHETQTAPKFDYGAVLGVAVEKSDRSCLDIRNANLSVGQRIQFVTLVPSPSTGDAEVIRKVEQACTTADQNKALIGLIDRQTTSKVPAGLSLPIMAGLER